MPDDPMLDFRRLVSNLYDLSRPDGRVSQHLLLLDPQELTRYAYLNPASVRQGEPADV